MVIDDLKGKTVLITGAATGIGASMVDLFIKEGSCVCFCDINTTEGEKLARNQGENAHFTYVDMSKKDQIEAWVSACGKKHDRIDVLVNNVGNDERFAFGETAVEHIADNFNLNYCSALYATHAAIPFMKDVVDASIINLGSVTYQLGYAQLSGYVPAKAALIGLTRTLARELGPKGIRVNTLSPGWVMTERQLRDNLNLETQKELEVAQCDPRLIEPVEIANLAVFLASKVSAAITGQNLLADRGWAHL